MRRRELVLTAFITVAGCRSGGPCRPEPVPTDDGGCKKDDGSVCVDRPHEPGPPPVSTVPPAPGK